MPKGDIKKDPYPLTPSDWITILQEKTSSNINLQLVTGTTIIAIIVAIPLIYNEFMGLNLVSIVLMFIVVIILLGMVYFVTKRLNSSNKLLEALYEKIIKGEITEPNEILKEYNKIKKK